MMSDIRIFFCDCKGTNNYLIDKGFFVKKSAIRNFHAIALAVFRSFQNWHLAVFRSFGVSAIGSADGVVLKQ